MINRSPIEWGKRTFALEGRRTVTVRLSKDGRRLLRANPWTCDEDYAQVWATSTKFATRTMPLTRPKGGYRVLGTIHYSTTEDAAFRRAHMGLHNVALRLSHQERTG